MSQKNRFFALAVFVLAANLRASIIVVGPILERIGAAVHAGPALMGFVGALPLLAFALCSPFAARLAEKRGLENVILFGLGLIAAGSVIRSLWHNVYTVMLGTFILCSGIALGNVLLAAAIRRNRPDGIARMSAVQMVSFSISAVLASALAVPLAQHFGWQWALAIWALPVLPALYLWRRIRAEASRIKPAGKPVRTSVSIWRSPLAWYISLFTGIQSMLFYTLAFWLPSMISAKGFSAEQAGWRNTIFQFIALPTVILLTPLAERYRHIHHLIFAAAACVLAGLLGFWYAPGEWISLAVAVMGIGSAACFTFCLILFALRGRDAGESAALSGMAQTIGYLVAGAGPLFTGWLLEYSRGWQVPVYSMFAAALVLMLIGWFAGQPGELTAGQRQPAKS